MLTRISVIMLNTYREAVRARVLHGLFALAIATAGYALVVGEFASKSRMRVVSDVGAASISVYGIVVAVVLSATGLYRELELKTIFPILARPIRRTEYLLGKYAGTLLTMLVFIAANSGALLLALSTMAGRPIWQPLVAGPGVVLVGVVAAWRLAQLRAYVPIPLAAWLLLSGWLLSAQAVDERAVVLFSALLTWLEVGIVAAIAMFFASFSSPFLTAVFTFALFIIGRSAQTLANMPERIFGPFVAKVGQVFAAVVPNLMLYVPPRTLLTGESGEALAPYIGLAALHAVGWSAMLLAVAALIFRRRDFL